MNDRAKGNGRILLLACGALAREVLALKAMNGWDDFSIDCLPADLHYRPERITPAIKAKLDKARGKFDRIFVLYADCGTGGELDRLLEAEGIERIAGPHCYSFFDGNDAFAARAEEELGTFYLTDFMVRHFETFVWKGLWLDRHPELLPQYFAHYTKLIYLAQTDSADFRIKAQEIATRLGLAYDYRFNGYGDLAGFMQSALPPSA